MRTPPRQLPKVLISQDKDKDFENAAIFFAKKIEKNKEFSVYPVENCEKR